MRTCFFVVIPSGRPQVRRHIVDAGPACESLAQVCFAVRTVENVFAHFRPKKIYFSTDVGDQFTLPSLTAGRVPRTTECFVRLPAECFSVIYLLSALKGGSAKFPTPVGGIKERRRSCCQTLIISDAYALGPQL
jgi:hypothetical protein